MYEGEPFIPDPPEPHMPGLSVITVKKDTLLEKIKKNRKEHREEFEKALKGYRKLVIKELDKMLEEAKAKKRIRRSISLPEPQDHTEEYDRVIEMIDMSVSDEIELTQQEFAQYVRDDWGWKHQFATTSSYYLENAK